MKEEEIKDLYSYKKQFIDYIESIRNNCSVLNESFDGYVILEDKLKSVYLESLLSYKYVLPSSLISSLLDNTLETFKMFLKNVPPKISLVETERHRQ